MFTGYTDQTVDVFWGIRFNNDRAWFAEHKQEFQDAVMTPTKALAGDLYDWFQEAYPDLHLNVHISRIYRDARRLFGRGPLNDHIWFSFQNAIENRGEAPCFWFQVGADGYGCGAGWWMPAASGVQLRRLLDNDPKRAEKLLRQLDAQQEYTLSGPAYARPKGHAGEPVGRLYNMRSFSIESMHPFDERSSGRHTAWWINTKAKPGSRAEPGFATDRRAFCREIQEALASALSRATISALEPDETPDWDRPERASTE